jgi:methylisocitrate lyase
VAPKPLNVLMGGPGLSVAQLADLGRAPDQRRRGAGPRGLGRLPEGGARIAEAGTFSAFAEAATGAELKALLKPEG